MKISIGMNSSREIALLTQKNCQERPITTNWMMMIGKWFAGRCLNRLNIINLF